MAINYKNLTPDVYQSSYSSQQSKKPVSSSKSYPVMGATVSKPNPVSTMNAFLQPYKPSTSVAKGQAYGQTQSKTAPMSYAITPVASKPKINTALQSGYGTQYGNNQFNQPTPKPTNTMNSWMNGVNALNARTSQFYNTSEANRLALANKRYQDTVGIQNEMFDNANRDLRGEIPRLDERFGKFEQGVRANMAEAEQIGAEQKGNAQTYTGSSQRTAMENKRDTDAQREKQYGALGTIDSYGTGSFTQGNANADTEFNRSTQQRYDALAQNLTDIDRTVANAKRDALALIDQERTKYEDTVRQINAQLRDNEVARRAAITDAYNSTQELINDITDQYEGLRISSEQQKMSFEQEMIKLQEENTAPNLSQGFMQTGQPQTAEDYNFIIKNPAGATALQKMIGTGSSNGQTSKKVADIVSQLQGVTTKGITGIIRNQLSDESRTAGGLLKQLSSELQIEEAKRLKGQGAMSDSERAILANSVASFNLDKNGLPQVSDERFREILDELTLGVSSSGGRTIRVKNIQTGQTGTIPENEFDPTLYARI